MRFKKHIFVCTNVRHKDHPKGSCGGKGSESVVDKLRKKIAEIGLSRAVRVNSAGCLGACEHGIAIVIYPEGVWYGGVSEENIEQIVSEHLLKGEIVESLLIKDEQYMPELMKNLRIEPLKQDSENDSTNL